MIQLGKARDEFN